MKLTKYEHACFSVEHDGMTLIVDPGNFTTDFIAPEGVVAVVITHEHSDHFDHEQLTAIIDKNPDAIIISHPTITAQIEAFESRAVLPGDHVSIGPFELSFYGGEHAIIHADIPAVANIGVLINDLLYYPGDSLVRPDVPVDTLALPIGAPWLKLSEAIDFVRDVSPRFVFPTHDAVLSDIGKSLPDRLVPALTPNTLYERIERTIDI